MTTQFEGLRDEANELVEDLRPLMGEVLSLKDEIGTKKSNVYMVEVDEDDNQVFRQILPSPSLSYSTSMMQKEGGVVNQVDATLTAIPISKYSENDLKTFTEDEEKEVFWFIDGKAFTTVGIFKRLLTWTVTLKRFSSYNEGDLLVPTPLGLNGNEALLLSDGVALGI